jgi:hypothetical protein
MSMSPAVQLGEGGSVGVGSSTGPRQLNPAVPGLSSFEAQPMQSTVSNSDYLHLSVVQRQVLRPAPSSAKKRHRSELDRLDAAQHTQAGFLNQHALENEPTPDEYTYSWSNSLPANPTAQYHAAVPADMVPGLSSLHRESVGSLLSEESFQPSSSSSLQDDLDSGAMPSPSHASLGVPSHSAGHILPQQDISEAAPEPQQKKRRPGQRKRTVNPKDPKAAERLQIQRQSDDEHIEHLYKLFVPSSEGEVPKKDRLSLSTSQSLCLSS